jgi:hypothetical protein
MAIVTSQSKTSSWKHKVILGIGGVGLSIWVPIWPPNINLADIGSIFTMYSLIGLYFVAFTLLLQRCEPVKHRQGSLNWVAAFIALNSILPFFGMLFWLLHLVTSLPEQHAPYQWMTVFLVGSEQLWSALDEDFGWSSRVLSLQTQGAVAAETSADRQADNGATNIPG